MSPQTSSYTTSRWQLFFVIVAMLFSAFVITSGKTSAQQVNPLLVLSEQASQHTVMKDHFALPLNRQHLARTTKTPNSPQTVAITPEGDALLLGRLLNSCLAWLWLGPSAFILAFFVKLARRTVQHQKFPTWAFATLTASGGVATSGEAVVGCPVPSQEPGWSSLAQYDWVRQWYAAAWCVDLPPGLPHKVTIFDTDYVVVRSATGGAPRALLDRCPHRLAALSEGRVTSKGDVQCAYHGWTFDEAGKPFVPQSEGGAVLRCATPVPCREEGGLLWILPDPTCADPEQDGVPPPAMPQEMRDTASKWKCISSSFRDLPVDYSIVMENLIDFDHGLFAHAAVPFDLYSGTAENPQEVAINHYVPGSPTPFSITMRTAAVPKVGPRMGGDAKPAPDQKVSCSTFVAPAHVVTGRRDPVTDKTTFLALFWVLPVGVGRSRLLLASLSQLAAGPPRWLSQLFLNRFLDEDSHLLATQQQYTLAEEFAAAAAGQAMRRTQVYAYASPGERLLVALGRFLDATVPRQPKRYAKLSLSHVSPPTAAALETLFACPPREVTLDRYAQHTALCPGSQVAVRNAQRLALTAAVVAGGALLVVGMAIWAAVASAGTAGVLPALLANKGLVLLAALAGAAATAARWVARQFYFVFPAEARDRHLRKIARVAPLVA